MRSVHCLLPAFLVAFLVPLAGCGKAESEAHAESHDHGHDHGHEHAHRPESLHAAVAELTEMRDTIRDAILAGDSEKAHGPLHEVYELLETIPDIAAETDLPEAEWDAVQAAKEELLDAFGAIDKAFHGKGGDKKAAYEGVAEQLDDSLEAIRSRLPLTGEEPEGDHDDHDHEGHDHEGHDHEGEHDHGEEAS